MGIRRESLPRSAQTSDAAFQTPTFPRCFSRTVPGHVGADGGGASLSRQERRLQADVVGISSAHAFGVASKRVNILRRQALDAPGRALAAVAEPIVHPIRSALPKLDGVRNDAIAAPVCRSRDVIILGKLG